MCDIDKNQLFDNLKVFIVEQKAWLQNTLNSVGWNISDLETLTKVCSFLFFWFSNYCRCQYHLCKGFFSDG